MKEKDLLLKAKQKKMRNRQIADILGVSSSAVSHYISGRHTGRKANWNALEKYIGEGDEMVTAEVRIVNGYVEEITVNQTAWDTVRDDLLKRIDNDKSEIKDLEAKISKLLTRIDVNTALVRGLMEAKK